MGTNIVLITSTIVVAAVILGCTYFFGKFEKISSEKYESLSEEFANFKWHLTEFGLIKYHIQEEVNGTAWVIGENFMGQRVKIKGFTQKSRADNYDDASRLLRILEGKKY